MVIWKGVELGRTKTCPGTYEPDWGKEKFQLALGDDSNDDFPPLVMEVWDEDILGSPGDFLGQVTARLISDRDRVPLIGRNANTLSASVPITTRQNHQSPSALLAFVHVARLSSMPNSWNPRLRVFESLC